MKSALGFALLMLLPLGVLRAGEIYGRVISTASSPVIGASIILAQPESGFYREVVTRAEGRYLISGLPQGVFNITISGPGGRSVIRRHAVVGTPDATVRLDFRLPLELDQETPPSEEDSLHLSVDRMDLNVLRRKLMIGTGPTLQPVLEFHPSGNSFGAEWGGGPRPPMALPPRSTAPRWATSISESFQNDLLNARSFFTAGDKPASRVHQYQVTTGGPFGGRRFFLTASIGHRQDAADSNESVQIPLPDERVPLTADPRDRAVIENLLRAYPGVEPNLPFVTPRQWNANASRSSTNTGGLIRLDRHLGLSTNVAARYAIDDFSERPAELVLGQNPATGWRAQRADLSVKSTVAEDLVAQMGFLFDRATTDLSLTSRYQNLLDGLGTPTNVPPVNVPDVEFQSGSLQRIGPGSSFPRRRTRNRFQMFTDLAKGDSRQKLTIGWRASRIQLNDLRSDDRRGTLIFSDDFGHTEIENFLLGRPSLMRLSAGDFDRGFRNWEHAGYGFYRRRLLPNLHLSAGLRYEMATAPAEVRGRTRVEYRADTNNFSPRVGFAWNPRRGGTVLRGGYGISYGTIFPATYQFSRFQPPEIQMWEIPDPSLEFVLAPPESSRLAIQRLSATLETPYSHQYTLALERDLPGTFFLRMAYFGSRSFHLFAQKIYNRAGPADSSAIPNNTTTIDLRRADGRYSAVRQIESDGISYFDAGQITAGRRMSRGLAFRLTYTWSKNLDLGGDFTNTASGMEIPPETGIPSAEFVSGPAKKGWSAFDTPHSLTVQYAYSIPAAGHLTGWRALLLRDWELSGTTTLRSGTPFSVSTSDAAGLGNVDGVYEDRPNLLDPAILGRSFDDPDESRGKLQPSDCRRIQPNGGTGFLQCPRFDTDVPVGGRGNLGYHVFRKDGTHQWNLSITKRVRTSRFGPVPLEIRASFYNVWNHAQFDRPEAVLNSPNFGQITRTVNRGRVIDLWVRMNF